MQRNLLLLLIFLKLIAFAQINEKFEDGDFTKNPKWTGDTSEFQIVDNRLQSNCSTEYYEYELLCPSIAFSEEILIDVELDFKTSSANYIDLILYRDSFTEYFLRIGGTKDAINLYYQAAQDSLLLSGPENISENSRLIIRCIQKNATDYVLQYQKQGSSEFAPIGEFSLNQKQTHLIGWRIKQSTSSFFYKHKMYSLYAGPKIYDTVAPLIDSLVVINKRTIGIYFNEEIAIDSSTKIGILHYERDSIWVNRNCLLASFTEDIAFSQQLLNLSHIQDTSGNVVRDTVIHFQFFLTSEPKWNNLIINEILFDPKLNGEDYIEIYNNSTNYIELSSCSLHRWRNNELVSSHQIIKGRRVLFPYTYLVCTADTSIMCVDYNCTRSAMKIQCSIPAMNNDEGIVVLTYKNMSIDSLHYFADWHLSLLPSVDGVSLERILFNGPTNSANNWHSASEAATYGTPGYKNSQSLENLWYSTLNLQYETVSPNGDGMQDFLLLNYEFTSANNIMSAFIYALDGRLIEQLTNAMFLNTSGSYSWDLVLNNGLLLPDSKYIMYLEVFNTDGKVLRKKLPFSVVSQ